MIGYEEERLTRVKSTSAFPTNAISAIRRNSKIVDFDTLFVSHWFDGFDPSSWNPKYWNGNALNTSGIVTLSKDFTHHDAHAWSALSFFKCHATPADLKRPWHVFVADGFGNLQEVISIYKLEGGGPSLVRRVSGYKNSLGLLYQYATSFCGMKENQDEYKFLGYESKIFEHLSAENINGLKQFAARTADEMFKQQTESDAKPDASYINVDQLRDAKGKFYRLFEAVRTAVGQSVSTNTGIRSVIGFFVQSVVEQVYRRMLAQYNVENVIVTGGLHYNVKLNNHILGLIPGKICAMPLAGDQGAGIGVYENSGGRFPTHSFLWGRRDLNIDNIVGDGSLSRYVVYTKTKQEYVKACADLILKDELVNTITGSLEFGPRALCNTSTLAIPSSANVDAINITNGRDTVMPFAPVMLDRALGGMFSGRFNDVVGSLQYMIITLDYENGIINRSEKCQYQGVAHPYPLAPEVWSGRPQVILEHDQRPIHDILHQLWGEGLEAVINTSLNVHGVPIVFSLEDALHDLKFNHEVAEAKGLKKPFLVIGDL